MRGPHKKKIFLVLVFPKKMRTINNFKKLILVRRGPKQIDTIVIITLDPLLGIKYIRNKI